MKVTDFYPENFNKTVHSSLDIFESDQFPDSATHKLAEIEARQSIIKALAKTHGCVIHSQEDSMRFGYVKNIKNYMEHIKSGRHKIL